MATKQYKVTLTDEVATFLKAEDSRGRLSEGIDRLVQRVQSSAIPAAAHLAPSRHAPQTKTLDLPDEDDHLAQYINHPDNPFGHLSTAKSLAKKDMDAKAAVKKAHDTPRIQLREEYRDILANPSRDGQVPAMIESYADLIPAGEMQAIMAEIRQDLDGSIAADRAAWTAADDERRRERQMYQKRFDAYIAAGLTENEAHKRMAADDGVVQTLKLCPAALKACGFTETPADMTDEIIRETNSYYETLPATPKHEPTLSELWAANPLEVSEDDANNP